MDIRNFFGQPRSQAKAVSVQSGLVTEEATQNSKKSDGAVDCKPGTSNSFRKRRIVDDDDDENDSCSHNTPDISETVEIKSISSDGKSFKLSLSQASDVQSSSQEVQTTDIKVASDITTKKVNVSMMKDKTTVNMSEATVKTTRKPPRDVEEIVSWKAGEHVPYSALVDTFDAVSKATGRLDKENLFCRLFRAVIITTPEDLDAIVYLASNSVSPAYEGLELGIGDSLLVKAVCEATGRRRDAVEEDYQREVGRDYKKLPLFFCILLRYIIFGILQ